MRTLRRKGTRLYYQGRSTHRLGTRPELNGKPAGSEFGFSLEVAGFAPMHLYCGLSDLPPLLNEVERNMPKSFVDLLWLEQVECMVGQLERVDHQEQIAVTALALYLTQTCPFTLPATLTSSECRRHVHIEPVHLFMTINAMGAVEVGVLDETEITLASEPVADAAPN
jgi:hypothetical protein